MLNILSLYPLQPNARQVRWEHSKTHIRDLLEKLDSAGYPATLEDDSGGAAKLKERRSQEVRAFRTTFFLSVLLTIPVFLLNMVLPRTDAKANIMHEIVYAAFAPP